MFVLDKLSLWHKACVTAVGWEEARSIHATAEGWSVVGTVR